MHKLYLNKSPEWMSNMFTIKKDVHNYNTRQKLHLHNKNNHDYIYQGVYIWNMKIDNIELRISFFYT